MLLIRIGGNLTVGNVAVGQGLYLSHLTAAVKAYGRALRAINRTLDMQNQRTIDHTFMAIELFYFFESLSDTESSLRRSDHHLRGMISII